MGYLKLMPGESLIYSTRQSKWSFSPGIITLIIFPVAFYYVGIWLNIGLIPVYAFTIIALIILLKEFIEYISCRFTITSRRVITKTGFIRRNINEMMLNRIESIQVHQNIISRIFNIGSVFIYGTGSQRNIAFTLARPLDFKQAIQQQIES
jgi:uncharacterized membrane protein YdbT with pleckstrin-like domain